MISAGWPTSSSTGRTVKSTSEIGTLSTSDNTRPRCKPRRTASSSRAPSACATIGSSANSTPMPKIEIAKKYMWPSATDASAPGDTRPTMMVSTTPISIVPT